MGCNKLFVMMTRSFAGMGDVLVTCTYGSTTPREIAGSKPVKIFIYFLVGGFDNMD